jgi:Tfp pilus assembly protein PilV
MKKHDSNLGFSVVEALLILVVVGILGFTGWYVYHAKQTSDKNYSAASESTVPTYKKKATTNNASTSKVVSLDDTYDMYTNNSLGISLTYSKMVANTAECSGTATQITPKVISIPVQVYEDTTNDKIFVAASKHDVTQSHQISAGTYQGYDSCVIKDTTLSDIENPVSTQPNNSWMLSVEFDYAKVPNTAGLDAFVAAHAPQGIVIDHSVAPSQSGNVSTYKLRETENYPVSGGWYFLKYNSSKKTAVFWSTPNTQAPVWADVDDSGGFVGINAPTANLL